MKRIKKAVNIILKNGPLTGTVVIYNIVKNKLFNTKSSLNPIIGNIDIISFYDFINYKANHPVLSSRLNKENKHLLWFIPDFGIGSGGHLNIFRMIANLEKFNVKSDIVICGHSQWGNETIVKNTIEKHFFKLQSKIYFVHNEKDITNLPECDIAMATSWQTAYYVRNYSKCFKKSYFVQDYEPLFSALGSVYSFAQKTYTFGFYGITAGSWLSEKLSTDYGMKCDFFSFSYEREIYKKHARNKADKKHIFFYARPPTERRAFELGLLVLDRVTKLRPDIAIIFAGWDVSNYRIPFHHLNAGIVNINELSHLYSQCDASLVLSFTNLSLLPLELLASGCPVVINNGYNNSWIDSNKKLFVYADDDVDSLSKALIDVVDKKSHIDFDYINKFLSDSSWDAEAKKVNSILEKLLRE